MSKRVLLVMFPGAVAYELATVAAIVGPAHPVEVRGAACSTYPPGVHGDPCLRA